MTDIEPVPAATVVLIRENARQQELEVLLVQRNSRLVFHGGHWVFPGGRPVSYTHLTLPTTPYV